MEDFDELLDGVVATTDKKKPAEKQATDNSELEKSLAEAQKQIAALEKEKSELLQKLDAAFSAVKGEAGKPLIVSIDDVIEDPERPNTRQEPNPEFEAWLTQNIKEQKEEGGTGIQDPISVRWSEELQKWIINKGHTRKKCGKAAGLTEVPIIIQDESTDWNQVIENLIRDGLSTKDMVAFIMRKKEQGIKQNEIAKRLSRDKGWVSKHVALANPPTFIQSIWDNKYATDFTVLYGLVTAYKQDGPFVEEEVNKVIAKKKAISEDDINAIKKALTSGKNEDQEEGEEEPQAEEEQTTEEETTEPQAKTALKLQMEFEGQPVYLVIQEPSEPGNLVMELESGSIMEAPVTDVKITGMVSVEV